MPSGQQQSAAGGEKGAKTEEQDSLQAELTQIRCCLQMVSRESPMYVQMESRIAAIQKEQEAGKPFWKCVASAAGQLQALRAQLDKKRKAQEELAQQKVHIEKQLQFGQDEIVAMELREKQLQAVAEPTVAKSAHPQVQQWLQQLPGIVGVGGIESSDEARALADQIEGLVQAYQASRPKPQVVPPPPAK